VEQRLLHHLNALARPIEPRRMYGPVADDFNLTAEQRTASSCRKFANVTLMPSHIGAPRRSASAAGASRPSSAISARTATNSPPAIDFVGEAVGLKLACESVAGGPRKAPPRTGQQPHRGDQRPATTTRSSMGTRSPCNGTDRRSAYSSDGRTRLVNGIQVINGNRVTVQRRRAAFSIFVGKA